MTIDYKCKKFNSSVEQEEIYRCRNTPHDEHLRLLSLGGQYSVIGMRIAGEYGSLDYRLNSLNQ